MPTQNETLHGKEFQTGGSTFAVIPAKAGIQSKSRLTGFPLPRE